MLTLVLGCGYSGLAIARALSTDGDVIGTRRGADGIAELAAHGVRGMLLDPAAANDPSTADDAGGAAIDAVPAELLEVLPRVTHLVSSVAPAREPPLDDPMLKLIEPLVAAGSLPGLEWMGYLSTIGVYGDHDGGWVDEDTPCTSRQPRSVARREAELAWAALGERAGVPVAILRLSGIYGPGRNAVRDALAGRGRMLIKPGQVFNRIHVDDIAEAAALAARGRIGGLLNVTDDEPAAPQDVIRHAHGLVGRAPPPAVDFAVAEVPPMVKSFYSENKRVDNVRSKSLLGLRYRHPDYRAGLGSLLEGELAEASPDPGPVTPGHSTP